MAGPLARSSTVRGPDRFVRCRVVDSVAAAPAALGPVDGNRGQQGAGGADQQPGYRVGEPVSSEVGAVNAMSSAKTAPASPQATLRLPAGTSAMTAANTVT